MSVFKASAARPHQFDDEPRICFVCLTECESNEKYDDLVRCDFCAEEDKKMRDSTFDYIDEREARERIA